MGYAQLVRDTIDAIKSRIMSYYEDIEPIYPCCGEVQTDLYGDYYFCTSGDLTAKWYFEKGEDATYKWEVHLTGEKGIYKYEDWVFLNILSDTSGKQADFFVYDDTIGDVYVDSESFLASRWYYNFDDTSGEWVYYKDWMLNSLDIKLTWTIRCCTTSVRIDYDNDDYRIIENTGKDEGNAFVTLRPNRWIWVRWYANGGGEWITHNFPDTFDQSGSWEGE